MKSVSFILPENACTSHLASESIVAARVERQRGKQLIWVRATSFSEVYG
jgi:hypothetical protein